MFAQSHVKLGHAPQGPFSNSDLIITGEGRIYHLDLKPEELRPNVLLVGDPERVSWISEKFGLKKDVERFHRGLRTISGSFGEHALPVSIVTSGMGTPSLEIVFSELVALREIDFTTRKRIAQPLPLTIIRVGTSGAIQSGTVLGTPIVSRYAVGLDNTGLFYDVPSNPDIGALERSISSILESTCAPNARFRGKISPYAAEASNEVVAALGKAADQLGIAHSLGITVANAGFFGNQGRDILRAPLTVPDIDRALEPFSFNGLRIENMEMESSALFHLGAAHAYRVGAVCATVAHRPSDSFASDIPHVVQRATAIALRALELLSDNR